MSPIPPLLGGKQTLGDLFENDADKYDEMVTDAGLIYVKTIGWRPTRRSQCPRWGPMADIDLPIPRRHSVGTTQE
jgi:hypothetical protein